MVRSQSEGMGRREFIGAAASALFAGVVITVTGCSEDDPAGPAKDGSVSGTIANNHGHSVTITKAQIDAGGEVTLTFTGGAHSHTVTLAPAQVAMIKSGAGVHSDCVSTTTEGHSHNLMFM
jgi:hypothetical protein